MLAGRFELAWQASDRIRARNAPDPHRFWDGRSLAGKRLIVRCLHGFGDAVQMLRYIPALAQIATKVIVEVPPRLLPLAPCFAEVKHVISWEDDPPAWENQIEIMELPYFFRTTLADLPIARKYLQIPAAAVEAAAAAMGIIRNRAIGLVTSAGSWNPSRTLPAELLAPLIAAPGLDLWSLDHKPSLGLRSAMEACGDGIFPLAAAIASLDLVITVDTLAAHLAGALGKPCWLLLKHDTDWRWMHARADSPWYPTLRLFRQPQPDDWTSVIRTVCETLEAQ